MARQSVTMLASFQSHASRAAVEVPLQVIRVKPVKPVGDLSSSQTHKARDSSPSGPPPFEWASTSRDSRSRSRSQSRGGGPPSLRPVPQGTLSADTIPTVARELDLKRADLINTLRKRVPSDREVRFPDNDPAERARYVGSVNRAGVPHGRGSLLFRNGSRYDGDLRNASLSGFGVYVWPTGKRYCGEWLDGRACGFGVLTSASTEYSGMWQGGVMHGVGKLSFENGDVYEGGWANNARHGRGTYTWASTQLVYDGTFEANLCHGNGTLKFKNGRELKVVMNKHVTEECWTLSSYILALFFLLSGMNLVHNMITEEVRSQQLLDPTFEPSNLAFRYLFVALSLPMSMIANSVWLLLSVFASESESSEKAFSTWSMQLLQSDTVLPHARVLLLYFLQGPLRDLFAHLIFTVACFWEGAISSKLISDRMCWAQGLALGSLVVLATSCIHMLYLLTM